MASVSLFHFATNFPRCNKCSVWLYLPACLARVSFLWKVWRGSFRWSRWVGLWILVGAWSVRNNGFAPRSWVDAFFLVETRIRCHLRVPLARTRFPFALTRSLFRFRVVHVAERWPCYKLCTIDVTCVRLCYTWICLGRTVTKLQYIIGPLGLFWPSWHFPRVRCKLHTYIHNYIWIVFAQVFKQIQVYRWCGIEWSADVLRCSADPSCLRCSADPSCLPRSKCDSIHTF